MKKEMIKTLISTVALITLVMLLPIRVMAADKDTVVALGADLTESQKTTVLSLMGLTEADLANCTVITVTNADEHKFLDGYIDSSVIGTRALTSVKMTKSAPGSGINVTTQNVNYCTTGMYRNALLTAGVEDRDVLVVAPTPISGTAGLIGAVRAYEVSTGETVSEDVLDGALDELITTGELNEQLENVSNEDVEALMAWLKNMIATGKLDTSDENSIRQTISEGEKQFGVTLTDDEKKQRQALIRKINESNLQLDLNKQAENLYKKYGSDVVNQAQDVINEAVGNAVSQATQSFFSSIKESFTGFFSNLFGR